MRKLLILPLAFGAALAGGAVGIVQDQCGPFTDVTPAFCPYILELYYLGITAGTSATTFSPDDPLTRGQGAVFIAKGLNQSLARSSRRAALGQWWTTQGQTSLGLTAVESPQNAVSDGADTWVTSGTGVARVRASDGKLLDTWPIDSSFGILAAMGRIFVTTISPNALYMIDPTQPAGPPQLVTDQLGQTPYDLAFDGSRLWVTGTGASVSIVTPGPTLPWSVTTVTEGFQVPFGIVFDGTNVWVGDQIAESLFRLDSTGSIVQTVPLSGEPAFFTFDGQNLWVPLEAVSPASVAVVQASTGTVLANLSGNGLTGGFAAAFDGQRILVTSGSSVSLWRAADLSALGSVPVGTFADSLGACSDGLNFWIALRGTNQLARF